MLRRFVVLLFFAGTATLTGCEGYSIPVMFSDLTHDPGHNSPEGSQEDTVRRIKESLASELTPQSTVQDGYRWFERHGIPVKSGHDAAAHEIYGGFMPFSTQGFWAATSVSVQLEFDEHGKYQHGDASWDASNL